MIAKRTGVMAEDPVIVERVAECLRLVGEEPIALDPLHPIWHGIARVVATRGCLARLPRGMTTIQLGGEAIQAPHVAAHLPLPLRLQSLLAALQATESLPDSSDEERTAARLLPDLVGTSAAVRRMRGRLASIAFMDTPVALIGEPGAGHADVAQALHLASRRGKGPFVPIDCAAIPVETLESELFGHEKGAFAGALSRKAGRIELASGGTLFVESMGELPFALQGRVLRALKVGTIERCGGAESVSVTPRIVVAATVTPDGSPEWGNVRADLLEALSACVVEVPALRERREDLRALIVRTAARCEAKHRVTLRFAPEALDALAAYGWPRNLHQLERELERLALQHGHETIGVCHLSANVATARASKGASDASGAGAGDGSLQAGGLLDPDRLPLLPVNGIDLRDYLTRLERSLIQQALHDTHHVVARAADRLHIRRTTLVEKMRKYGLSRLGHEAVAVDAIAGDAGA